MPELCAKIVSRKPQTVGCCAGTVPESGFQETVYECTEYEASDVKLMLSLK